MKLSDLFIGMWYAYEVDGLLCPMQVISGTFNLKDEDISKFKDIDLNDFILGRNFKKTSNGFDVCNMWRIWHNPNYGYILATLTIDEFGGGVYEPCIPCKTVRELQLFLKLKGIEKDLII
jgi:hypothetical protein